MSSPPLSYHAAPGRPKFALPPGACDAHVHVFGPQSRFPFAPGRSFTPCEASKEKLFALHALLGIERCVVVQSNAHGYDNSVTEDAIAARKGTYVGIALLPPSVDDAELARLDAAGFRGARFHFMRHLGAATPIEDVIAFGGRLAAIGWHLQLHFESSLVHELAPALLRSPVPVVIDHMARIDAARGLDQPDFRRLRELMRDARFFVKVSGPERASRQGPPYRDAVPYAKALVEEAGDRVLWGTDWPHPNLDHIPDDGLLTDLIAEIAPTKAQRQALLVDNPGRLYRFGQRR
ncbi:MAG TPA: amidohydrolase family protein [Casimicrobiaceae bacterium]|nr:amidohydrolase family protein [Casimicrobiaceae bacterium]